MAKTCQACGGAVCEICGGCVAHGECSCVEDQISDYEKRIETYQKVLARYASALRTIADAENITYLDSRTALKLCIKTADSALCIRPGEEVLEDEDVSPNEVYGPGGHYDSGGGVPCGS
jgi:hypothetical protein